ncbi:MAG: hypothetical protein KME31_36265 [Tolypothrix carrinoi HA7290-LM1]|nr:hypothetical protein [Tolypothrix carrinoi HA7290-LM1]
MTAAFSYDTRLRSVSAIALAQSMATTVYLRPSEMCKISPVIENPARV